MRFLAMLNAFVAGLFAIYVGPSHAIPNGLIAVVFAILSLKERP